MSRALAAFFFAVLIVIGLPVAANAAGDTPVIFASSASYTGQPVPYTITVFDRLNNSHLSASIGGRSMSCHSAGAIDGLGTWKCTASGGRLPIGSQTITARATGDGKTRTSSKTISISSSFGISSSSGSVSAGQGYTVSGHFDGGSYHVSARSSANGSTVQSGVGCSTSGTSFTCSLQAGSTASPSGTTYTVTVTESSGGSSRSDSTSVQVIGQGPTSTPTPTTTKKPGTPSFTSGTTQSGTHQPLTIHGRASASGQLIQLVVDPPASGPTWSAPTTSCTVAASQAWSCALPNTLSAGQHTITVRALDPTDPSKTSPAASLRITVTSATASPKPTASPSPSNGPSTITAPPIVEKTPTHKVRHGSISDLLELLILALAIIGVARPTALSRVLGGRSAAFSDDEADIDPEKPVRERVGRGDFSPTWAAFGHEATDFWSRTAPGYIARFSPFLGRLAVDGNAIRAIFGTLWYLLPIGGIALGITAAHDVASKPTAPSLGILLGIVVVSSFDAFAGFLASVVFAVLVSANMTTPGAVVVLALSFLWTGLPLIASTFRPLRRNGEGGWKFRWDRLADLAITAVVCGWIAARIAGALDILGDKATGIPVDAGKVALVSGGAIAVRVLVEHATNAWWPERLRFTEIPEPLPTPNLVVRFAGVVVRLAALGFLGHVFLGSCWQLWAGLVLFVLPDAAAVLGERGMTLRLPFPLPTGITALLIMVVVGVALVAAAISGKADTVALRAAFVAASLVPALLGAAYGLRGPDTAPAPETSEASDTEPDGGEEGAVATKTAVQTVARTVRETTWDLQLAGAGLLVTLLVLAIVGYSF
ncbi:MAG TPA: hypothetical protein VFE15_01830 [Marmoricola sp.]|nr:hypothetical protein [Marmoricola sp.]